MPGNFRKQTSNTEARNYFLEPRKFYGYFYDFSLILSSYLCADFIRNWGLWGEVTKFETDFFPSARKNYFYRHVLQSYPQGYTRFKMDHIDLWKSKVHS